MLTSKAFMTLMLCLLASTLLLTQERGGGQGQGGGQAQGRGGRGQQAPPPKEADVPPIPGAIAPGTKIRLVATGQRGVQGAIALDDGTLLFTERGGARISRMDTSGNFSVYLENTTDINSGTIDTKGRVVGVKFMPDGGLMQLAPEPRRLLVRDHDGKPFGRPNDILADRKGGVYWTDDLGLPEQNIKSTVYYYRPDGKNVVATDAVAKPNGVVLSPDDKILYVADGNGMYLIAFDVQSDGSLTNKRNHARLVGGREGAYPKDPFGRQDETGLASVADGLAVDREGRIYVTSTPGVQVISPDGKHLGTIPTTHALQNIAFAGKDMKSLYLFGDSNMYEVRTVVEGLRGRRK